ncbi:MAG: 7-dehydrocholesterol reductase [Parachlamydiaceae bacterium]
MKSALYTWARQTLVPLLLIASCPPFVFLFWYTCVFLDGSFYSLWQMIEQQGFLHVLSSICSPYILGTKSAWMIIGVFAVFELALMKLLPGKPFYGPVTPAGNVPIYKANGVAAYTVTLATFCICSFGLNLFSPTIIYDNFGGILGALNIFSLAFCFFLLIKGHVAPSSSDSGTSGNALFDYYWGMELYPRIFGWDVKMFTNCRFGMMSWPLIIISFAAKQSENGVLSDAMVVAVGLQLLYISKFFLWETGYLRSMDIMHDRAGFYICWGCLVWVPGIYTSPILYLVNHPNNLGLPLAFAIFLLGGICIMINYLADRQRQMVRATNGNCKVWGKKPMTIVGNYVTKDGENKVNLLLTSGWWGIARHFHYIPEISAAFFWTVPALFSNVLPYFYVFYLTLLLVNRAFRDDQRCTEKYGDDWQVYCQNVPYKLVPYVI